MLPIFLLAFANDKQNSGAGYLRGLTAERNAIRDALMKAEENGLCQVLVEPDATVDRIFDIFQNSNYRDRIAVFHYGGHAESYSLLLETASGEKAKAHSEGLVAFLSKQKSLKLVFLNGCSSQKQSEELVASGLPAVIGTSQVINDSIATSLASRFYKGLSQGMPIERSWTDAIDQIKTETGSQNSKALFNESILGSPGVDEFPWELYTGEGGSVSKAWNLPEAANQPLFGLELPKSYFRKLPLEPYVGLRSFKREEAAIFYGRGSDIRKFHKQLALEQPVILLSGKKGVGKSSLLAAGLAPRLESEYTMSMCRVENNDISDGLTHALDQVRASLGMEKLASKDKSDLEEKIADAQNSMSLVTGFSKSVLEKELARLLQQASTENLTFYEQWISIEEKTGMPLVVLFDELPSEKDQWNVFLEILVSVFETGTAPRGKMVISMDEESQTPFGELLQSARFPFAEIFLQPITKEGIHEAITGITNAPGTKEFYRLEIEDHSINSLPEALSSDLSDGDNTLVAPYLQVILSSLWKSAVAENAQTPVIRLNTYQQGILSGELMDQFLSDQLNHLAEWNEEPVQSGLALDLLYMHTSALGKSKILEASKRLETYGGRKEIVNKLVKQCTQLFLLTRAHSEATNLGHNMLAATLIRHYSISLHPGQQAARIINGKTGEATESGMEVWLNEADLEVVEKGIQGMRSLTDEEEALLEFSRVKKIQAQKERKRNRVIRGILVSVVAVFAALAGWQWRVAYQQYLYSRAGELAFTARAVLKKDNTLALNVASKAYSVLGMNSPPMVMQTLSDIYYTQEDIPLYASNYPHTKKVFTAVFSPDGQNVLTASEDGFAKLWDIRGKELLSLPHVIEVSDAIFSPNGKQILTLTRSHISLWERDGTLTDQDSIPEAIYSLDEFSTDGMKIIPKYIEREAGDYFSHVDSIRQLYTVVITSPIFHRTIALNYDHWSLFDEKGIAIRDSIPSQVFHASFSHDGKQFLTVTPDTTASRITVWSEAGDSLYSFKCNGIEVKAVFSADGKGFLTASNDFTAKLWDFSNPFLHRFPKQTAAMNTVDYFPDGTRYLTASYDSTAKIFDETGKQIGSLKHRGAVISAFFSPDGNRVITASRDSTARLWSPKEYKEIELLHRGRVECGVFSADGKFVLTASQDSLARLWSLDGVMIDSFHHNSDVTWAGFSPDGKRILTISKDDAVTLWDIKGNGLHVFQHPERVNSAAFSPDGAYLLTSCNDSIVRQFTLAGDSIHAEKHSEKPKVALYSTDGRHILTGGKTIHIWNAKWVLKASLIHAENVSSVTISPDGRQILTTCLDRNAYLWNFKGDNLAIYRKHSEKINSGIFIRDGSHVLTASDDGYILRWRTPQAIFEGLKTRIIYQLTKKEEEQFSIIW